MSDQECMQFDNLFKLVSKGLRRNGTHPTISKDARWYALFASIVVLNIVIWYLLANTILQDYINGNFDELCMTGFMFLLTNATAAKYFVLLQHKSHVMELINKMNAHYQQMNDMIPSEKEIVKKSIQKAYFINKLWTLMASATGLIFPIRSVAMMIYFASQDDFHLVQVFHLVYPSYLSGISELVLYIVVTTFTMAYDVFLMSLFLGFESLGPIFLIHCCSQLEIVEMKLMRVFKESSDSEEIGVRLREIAIMMQDIYGFVDHINAIYNVLYELYIAFTSVAIPIIAIQVIKRIQGKEPNPEELICLVGCFLHVYIPCYYSDMLKEKSESVRQAMYACGWENHPVVKHRKTLLIMMVRAMQPALIRTVFKIICLDEFANMVRTSYTLFNLLSLSLL